MSGIGSNHKDNTHSSSDEIRGPPPLRATEASTGVAPPALPSASASAKHESMSRSHETFGGLKGPFSYFTSVSSPSSGQVTAASHLQKDNILSPLGVPLSKSRYSASASTPTVGAGGNSSSLSSRQTHLVPHRTTSPKATQYSPVLKSSQLLPDSHGLANTEGLTSTDDTLERREEHPPHSRENASAGDPKSRQHASLLQTPSPPQHSFLEAPQESYKVRSATRERVHPLLLHKEKVLQQSSPLPPPPQRLKDGGLTQLPVDTPVPLQSSPAAVSPRSPEERGILMRDIFGEQRASSPIAQSRWGGRQRGVSFTGEAKVADSDPDSENRCIEQCLGQQFSIVSPQISFEERVQCEPAFTEYETSPDMEQSSSKRRWIKTRNLSLPATLFFELGLVYTLGFLWCLGTLICCLVRIREVRKNYLEKIESDVVAEEVSSMVDPSLVVITVCCACVFLYGIMGAFLVYYIQRNIKMAKLKLEELIHFFEMVSAWDLEHAPLYVSDPKLFMRLFPGTAETYTLMLYSKCELEQSAEVELSLANMRLRTYKNRLCMESAPVMSPTHRMPLVKQPQFDVAPTEEIKDSAQARLVRGNSLIHHVSSQLQTLSIDTDPNQKGTHANHNHQAPHTHSSFGERPPLTGTSLILARSSTSNPNPFTRSGVSSGRRSTGNLVPNTSGGAFETWDDNNSNLLLMLGDVSSLNADPLGPRTPLNAVVSPRYSFLSRNGLPAVLRGSSHGAPITPSGSRPTPTIDGSTKACLLDEHGSPKFTIVTNSPSSLGNESVLSMNRNYQNVINQSGDDFSLITAPGGVFYPTGSSSGTRGAPLALGSTVTKEGFIVPGKNAIIKAYRKQQPLGLRDCTILIASFSGFFDAMWFDQNYTRNISNLFLSTMTDLGHHYGGLTIVNRPDRIMIIWNTKALPRPEDHREVAIACGRELSAALREMRSNKKEKDPMEGFFPVLLTFSGNFLVGTIGETQLQLRLVVFGRLLQIASSTITLLHVLRQARGEAGGGWTTEKAQQESTCLMLVWMGNEPPPTRAYVPFDLIQGDDPQERYVLHAVWGADDVPDYMLRGMEWCRKGFYAFTTGEHEEAFQYFVKAHQSYPGNPLVTRLRQLAQYFALERGPPYSRRTPHWTVYGSEASDEAMNNSIRRREENAKFAAKAAAITEGLSPANPILMDNGPLPNSRRVGVLGALQPGSEEQEEGPEKSRSLHPDRDTGPMLNPLLTPGDSSPGSSPSHPVKNALKREGPLALPAETPTPNRTLDSGQLSLRPLSAPESSVPVAENTIEGDANRDSALPRRSDTSFDSQLWKTSESLAVKMNSEDRKETHHAPRPSVFNSLSTFGPNAVEVVNPNPLIASPPSSHLHLTAEPDREGAPLFIGTSPMGSPPTPNESGPTENLLPLRGVENPFSNSISSLMKEPQQSRTGENASSVSSHESASKKHVQFGSPDDRVRADEGKATVLANSFTSNSFKTAEISTNCSSDPLGRKPELLCRTRSLVPNSKLMINNTNNLLSTTSGADSHSRSNSVHRKSYFLANPLSLPAPQQLLSTAESEAAGAGGSAAVAEAKALSIDITDRQGLKFRLSHRVLGRGASGEVRLGLSHMGALVAVKVVELMVSQTESEKKEETAPESGGAVSARAKAIQKRRMRRKGIPMADNVTQTINSLTSEIEMLSRLRHSCIVGYIGAVGDTARLMLIMEYASGGSLQKVLDLFTDLTEDQALGYLKDVLHGLVYLHSQQIVHRDVKPDNVLVTVSGGCKLIDFGISKQISAATRAVNVDGTPFYMAPEAFSGTVTSKSDIWSFGIMLAQVLTHRLPWGEHATPISVSCQLCRDSSYRPEPRGGPLSPEAVDVFFACTQRDPNKRPTANAILQMTLFRNAATGRSLPSNKRQSQTQAITTPTSSRPGPQGLLANRGSTGKATVLPPLSALHRVDSARSEISSLNPH